jgi:hypothetical protein
VTPHHGCIIAEFVVKPPERNLKILGCPAVGTSFAEETASVVYWIKVLIPGGCHR